jgi:hypothetical protein
MWLFLQLLYDIIFCFFQEEITEEIGIHPANSIPNTPFRRTSDFVLNFCRSLYLCGGTPKIIKILVVVPQIDGVPTPPPGIFSWKSPYEICHN